MLQAFPEDRSLRLRVISFLHRLIECLGGHLLPRLPEVLSTVIPQRTDKNDLLDIFTLLNQLVTRYKAAAKPILSAVSLFRHLLLVPISL